MKDNQLAILGGDPVLQKPLKKYNHIGKEEAKAVENVLKTGILSDFIAHSGEYFLGGRKVLKLEELWQEYFDMKYAISMNSATSGLIAAIGAIGVGPGDEVIVSPNTMSASATAILIFNAIPVFADIEPETFNIDPDSIEQRITKNTKGLMIPNIFGHSADYDRIMEIARRHNLKVIEDSAQSPSSKYKGRFTGTIGDIGVFSLNRHKHIHTGEGGICVTNDDELAERMRLIRNHAEIVSHQKNQESMVNMVGFNFRMGEIEAAIGMEQLKKLESLVASRIKIANKLTENIGTLDGLEPPIVKPECTHVYYVYAWKYKRKPGNPHRNTIVKALQAEGIPLTPGGFLPLYLQSIYQKKTFFGKQGCPFSCTYYDGTINYDKGLCPTAERMYEEELFWYEPTKYEPDESDLNAIGKGFQKVFSKLDQLEDLKDL